MPKNKRTTVREAVSQYLHDGDSIALSGIGGREPMAVVYEIIRQHRKDLTLIADSKMDSACMLIGAGCLKKMEVAYCWISRLGGAVNYRRAVEKGIPQKIEVEEYSNYAASLRFLAGAMDVPFLPTRSLLGSDLITHNPRIKEIHDPYTDQPIALVPAARPDVAFLHVQQADEMGNCQIWGPSVNDINIARAAKKVIVTCEEIVPTSKIRSNPNMTAIPHYCVDAVIEVPFCSHPFFVPGYYWCDMIFRRDFMRQNDNQEHFEEWLNEWVYQVEDFDAYLNKLGRDRLEKLRELELDNYQMNR